MSGGKGEALASELAALSVNEASAPPEGDGEKPSAEPAEGADSGGKITGVVSWFNVAKGFGATRRLSQRGTHLFFPGARSRGAPSARARARRGSRRLVGSLSSHDRAGPIDARAGAASDTPARLAIPRAASPSDGIRFSRARPLSLSRSQAS
jgi:hypothetical protein